MRRRSPPSRKLSRHRRLRVERLELRQMLSALSPLEVRHAYGFDALPLSGNDGTGQTIAIVDAYDAPNIFADLDVFDKAYGLTAGGPSLYDQYGPASSVLTKVTMARRTRPDSGWAEEIS